MESHWSSNHWNKNCLVVLSDGNFAKKIKIKITRETKFGILLYISAKLNFKSKTGPEVLCLKGLPVEGTLKIISVKELHAILPLA